MNVTEKLGLPSFIFGWILDHGWVQAMVAMWIVTPLMYYVIAAFFEKRLAPIWRYNHRAYVPGHLILGVVVACTVVLADGLPHDPDRWFRSVWYAAVCILITVAFTYAARFWREERTPDGLPDFNSLQARSPTLLYYDFVVTPLSWFLVLKFLLPALVHGVGDWPRLIATGSALLAIWLTGEDPRVFHWKQWARIERAHPEYGFRLPWSKYAWTNDNCK